MVREPKVFLMDEPLSNLDAKLRVATRAEIIDLHQRIPTTTIYVTHDQVEAMTMGDRVAVLSGGLIQQYDVPRELYDHPANLFVAGFIGSPAMNFRLGHVHLYVANLQDSKHFYRDVLGFQEFNLQSRFGEVTLNSYLPHVIAFNTGQGEGAPPPPANSLTLTN